MSSISRCLAQIALMCSLLVPLGCSKPDATSTAASAAPSTGKVLEHCETVGGAATCIDYMVVDENGVRRKLCEEFKSKFGDGACPTANRIGSCLVEAGQLTHYYDKTASKDWGYTVETAKKRCESELLSGKFTPTKK